MGLAMTIQGSTQGQFLGDIEVKFGPPEVFGRFFLKADAAARARGVHLSFGTFDELVAANRANSASWRRIVTMFDPAFCDLSPDRAVCVLGRNAAGEVVATQASRMYTLTDTTLYDELTSLRAFYDHPERDKRPGETCTVSAEATKGIDGRVVCSGATWYRPDYRGVFLSSILTRISRAYAYTRWSTDFSSSLLVEPIVKGGVMARAGYKNIDWAIDIKNSPLGDVRCAYVWMGGDELVADLRNFLASFDAQVDTPVVQRRA